MNPPSSFPIDKNDLLKIHLQLIVLKDPHDDIDDILRANRSRERQYVFDHVFSCKASQEDVYCAVVQDKGIIESVLSGFNCTVFAYGATGNGNG